MNRQLNMLCEVEHTIINWVFLLAVAFGNFLNNYYFFGAVVLIAIIVSVVRFQHDKKWLKRADKYVRLSIKIPFWRTVIAIVAIICIGLSTQLDAVKPVIEKVGDLIQNATIFSWFAVAIALHYGDYYHKFVDSIKSFDDGIQLPGRKSELIPWKEIYQFEFDETVLISSSKGENRYYIDPEDVGFTNGMISDWKNRKKLN